MMVILVFFRAGSQGRKIMAFGNGCPHFVDVKHLPHYGNSYGRPWPFRTVICTYLCMGLDFLDRQVLQVCSQLLLCESWEMQRP
jgi:hypothetical protein